MNEIQVALYQRQERLKREMRLRQGEHPAMRSSNGAPYPEGSAGQTLLDFSTGTMYYWDSAYWAAWSRRRMTINGANADEFIVPLPATAVVVTAVHIALKLDALSDASNYFTFSLSSDAGMFLSETTEDQPSGESVIRLTPDTALDAGEDFIHIAVGLTGSLTGEYSVMIEAQDVIEA